MRIELIEACHSWNSSYYFVTMMSVDLHRVWSCEYKYKVHLFDSVDVFLCHQRTVIMLTTFSLQV